MLAIRGLVHSTAFDCACVGSCIVDHDALCDGRLHMEIRNRALVYSHPLEGSCGTYVTELESIAAGLSRELMF